MVNSNISLCNVIMATSEDINQTRVKCVAKHENIHTTHNTRLDIYIPGIRVINTVSFKGSVIEILTRIREIL
jgi:NAD/NADP transhydrogenase beta subunit